MSGPGYEQTREAVLAAFEKQVGWCESLGSPFTARVLRHLVEDIAEGGLSTALTNAWRGEPVSDALALRFAGALHALVLRGAAPELIACYPPQPTPPLEQLRPALIRAVGQHADFIRNFINSPPQTNEVGRSAVFLGGFLTIASETGLPLRTLEIGASAGLNTLWDRYHYRFGGAEWGHAESPVRLSPDWQGPLPPMGAQLLVAERLACDVAPIELEDAEQRLRLRAYVWADQRERLARLEAAIGIVRRAGQKVEQADAADWVRVRLQEPAAGRVSVLFHSIMWQYMPAKIQADIEASLQLAGSKATENAPVAWLRFEPPRPDCRPELRLTLWPNHREICLAVAQPHGASVVWRPSIKETYPRPL